MTQDGQQLHRGETRRRLAAIARQIAPWLVAALAIWWVTRSVDWGKVYVAFIHVPYVKFVLASIVLLALNCAADSAAMYYTFGWFGCRVPYRELYTIRAATYLLAVVQYYVGQAAILGFLRQRRGVPLGRGAGWILFISGINMAVLVILASTGMSRAQLPEAPWLRWVPPVVGVGALAYFAVIWLKPRRLASISLLAPMFEMGVLGHIKSTLVRLPHVTVLLVWHYLALRWFGVAVPPLVALVYLPAVFFFAALPVSVQGLGLSQWAAVTFFASYAPHGKAAVLAYSLSVTAVALVIQVIMGVIFLRAAQRLGLRETVELETMEAPPHAPGTEVATDSAVGPAQPPERQVAEA